MQKRCKNVFVNQWIPMLMFVMCWVQLNNSNIVQSFNQLYFGWFYGVGIVFGPHKRCMDFTFKVIKQHLVDPLDMVKMETSS